jgi:membrane protein YqaA with SNARE-associated domain
VIAGEKTDAEKQAEEEQKRAMSQWWISALAAFAVIAIIVAITVVAGVMRTLKMK